jgi:hypothetical protein
MRLCSLTKVYDFLPLDLQNVYGYAYLCVPPRKKALVLSHRKSASLRKSPVKNLVRQRCVDGFNSDVEVLTSLYNLAGNKYELPQDDTVVLKHAGAINIEQYNKLSIKFPFVCSLHIYKDSAACC